MNPKTTYTGFQKRTPKEVAAHPVFFHKTVCDIGCGTGEFLAHLSEYATSVSGVEQSTDGEIASNEGFIVVQGKALQVNIPDAEVYYFWIQNLGDALQIIDEKNLTGTIVLGNYTGSLEVRYLEKIGAVPHTIKTTRGDFTIWVYSIDKV